MPFRAQLEECTYLTHIPSSTQGIRSELNSRYVPSSTQGTQQSYLWVITKSLVDHAYKVQPLGLTAAKLPSGVHVPLGASGFQITWRGTRTAKC